MNTPTLTEYEESIAPWNQNDEFDTYYVTATVSMPYTVAIDGNMDFIEVTRKILRFSSLKKLEKLLSIQLLVDLFENIKAFQKQKKLFV